MRDRHIYTDMPGTVIHWNKKQFEISYLLTNSYKKNKQTNKKTSLFLWKAIFIFLVFKKRLAAQHPGPGIRSELQLPQPCCSTGSFNPLCLAEGRACILALQRCCQSCCTTVGTPERWFLILRKSYQTFSLLSFSVCFVFSFPTF